MAVELNDSLTNKWSETDNSNTAPAPDGAPAGVFPNQSEPIWRGIMGTVKRAWDRLNGKLTVGGTANAITLTPSNTAYPTVYTTNEVYGFRVAATNTGAVTLNINNLGNSNLLSQSAAGPVTCTGGELVAGTYVLVAYDGAEFQIISSVPKRSFQSNIIAFSNSTTYNPSTGLVYAIAEAVGAGGSGGSCDANNSGAAAAGGGGGGEYRRGIFYPAQLGSSQTVTIGAGQTGPGFGAFTGLTGGSTSLGGLLVAAGGMGGQGAGHLGGTGNASVGGAGGSTGSGGFSLPGQTGGTGYVFGSLTAGIGGYGGGAGLYGKQGPTISQGSNGVAGALYGCGGGGACAGADNIARNGGASSNGLLIITEYIVI